MDPELLRLRLEEDDDECDECDEKSNGKLQAGLAMRITLDNRCALPYVRNHRLTVHDPRIPYLRRALCRVANSPRSNSKTTCSLNASLYRTTSRPISSSSTWAISKCQPISGRDSRSPKPNTQHPAPPLPLTPRASAALHRGRGL